MRALRLAMQSEMVDTLVRRLSILFQYIAADDDVLVAAAISARTIDYLIYCQVRRDARKFAVEKTGGA